MGILERKEREKEARRDEIISAAEKVFFQKGVSASTMDDIAAAAELSKGTLYLYYRSKEEIQVAVAERGMEILHSLCEKALSTGESPIRRIFNLADAYKRFFLDYRDYFRMTYFFESPQFHATVSEEVRKECIANDRRTWDLVTGVIRDAMAEGLLRPGLDPLEVAIMLWSNSYGFFRLIDRTDQYWSKELNIDLEQTWRRSSSLLMEAMMTDEARRTHPWVGISATGATGDHGFHFPGDAQ